MNPELDLTLQQLFERVPQTTEITQLREELLANTREKYDDLPLGGKEPVYLLWAG